MTVRPENAPAGVTTVLAAPGVAMIARVLLTAPFWWSGLSKAADFPSAVGEATHFGLRPAGLVALAIIVVQVAGSLAVVEGRWSWLGAAALCAFTVLATLVGHAFWTLPDPEARFHDLNAFLANVGLLGGLVLAAILAQSTSGRQPPS